jgi:hypothetical protein
VLVVATLANGRRADVKPRCLFQPRRIGAMARGVQKSNKEKRKPKQDKNKPGAKK